MPKRAMRKHGAQVRGPKAPKKGKRARAVTLPVILPDTAGIDIGAMEILVAVSPHRDTEPVRSFATFTRDLEAIAAWLKVAG